MPVVNGKIAALRPRSHIFPTRRLRHVQDDRYPILVIVPLDALMRVCSVRGDQAVGLRGELRWLKIFQWVDHLGLGNLEVDVGHLHHLLGFRIYRVRVRRFCTAVG